MWMWFFIASFALNIFAALYIKWLLSSIADMGQDMESLNEMIQGFSQHLKTIYEMEMFYGDETLKSLMSHANELSARLSEVDLIINEEEVLLEKAQEKD